MKLFTAALLFLSSIALCTPAPLQAESECSRPTVILDSGPVVGTTTSLPGASDPLVNKFLGIRFGAPPPRFSPPAAPEPWTEPQDATKYFPACHQQFSRSPERTRQWFNTPPPPEDEDCLGLNVWAPATKDDEHTCEKDREGKAVLFWLFGGGLQFGSGTNVAYDGASFAANQDVIVVTINYRTNIFGFPDIPTLPPGTNNLGFLDQRLALEWVQKNIAKFGGDPARVTIFGQSAGASSVDALVTAPLDPVPFSAAIYMSGQISLRTANPAPYAGWYATLNLTGCAGGTPEEEIACVSAIPAAELETLISVNAIDFAPIADNITLSSTARQDRLSSTPSCSKIARVPVLGGSTAEEGRTYALDINDTASYLTATYPSASSPQIKTILDAFAIGTPGIETVYDQASAILTHVQFQCTYATVSQDMRDAGIPSWRYQYNASFADLQLFEGSGVYHASDIRPVFGTIPGNGTVFERELSGFMQGVWAGFAKDPHFGLNLLPQVPSVAVLGGGVRDQAGPQTGALVTIVPDNVVDRRCAAIAPLYGRSD